MIRLEDLRKPIVIQAIRKKKKADILYQKVSSIRFSLFIFRF
jgi:hypothetical protein